MPPAAALGRPIRECSSARRIAALAASALTVPTLAIAGAAPAAAACGTGSYEDGTGTSTDPYIIAGPDDLTELKNTSEDWGCAFRQTADVGYSPEEQWTTSIGDSGDNFTGSYDGGGFTVSGLTIDRADEDAVGLFGYVVEGALTNVHFEGSVSGNLNVGGLVGHLIAASVSGSSATVTIQGGGSVGGLVGRAEVDATITGSSSSGSVQGNADNVGGLVGFVASGTVSNSVSSATVSVPSPVIDPHRYVGGILGNGSIVSLSNSSATGTITAASSEYVGGAVGLLTGDLNRVTASGNVVGGTIVGGLAGAIGSGETGAIRVSATGAVQGQDDVGGLVGMSLGTIDQGFSSGQVDATDDTLGSAGGLVGTQSAGSITNSYSISDVAAASEVGGLIGFSVSTVTNSYSAGLVGAAQSDGGLVGLGLSNLITGSFWDTETSGQASSVGGTGKTTEEMKDIATFSGASWDISSGSGTSSVWGICPAVNSGYPFLTWLYSADACGTPPTAKVEFTYWLPDGQECSMISPVQVVKGSWYGLPGADADCRSMEGSTIIGWTVPGSTRVFAPEAEVNVTGSQRFIAVLREPIVTVRYDANVREDVACLRDGENTEDRVDTVWLTREQVGSVALASGAVCAPTGYRLAGWTWRTDPETTSFEAGAMTPNSWNANGLDRVNSVDLYAVWELDLP